MLSMNAAVSSSVVLASRLDSDLSVFALVLLAVQIFALSPLLRKRLHVCVLLGSCHQLLMNHEKPKHTPALFRVTITASLALLSIFLMNAHSSTAGWIVAGTLSFITFVAPALLVWAQRYKK